MGERQEEMDEESKMEGGTVEAVEEDGASEDKTGVSWCSSRTKTKDEQDEQEEEDRGQKL